MIKKLTVLGAIFALANMAAAQVTTNLSVGGSMKAYTEAYHLVAKTGWTAGSGRGGHGHRYTYYVKVIDQSATSIVNYLLNGGVQTASSTNTLYSPNFTAGGTTSTTYSESGLVGVLTIGATETASALPSPAAPNYVDSLVSATPTASFSCPQDTILTVAFSGASASAATYSISGWNPDGDPTVTYVSLNTWILRGGSNFLINFSGLGLTGIAGTAGSNDLKAVLTLTQSPGSAGG